MFHHITKIIFKLITLTLILILLGTAWFGIHTAYSIYVGTKKPTERADVALILGAMVLPDGTLSKWLEVRTVAGLELYHQGMVDYIIVSGGMGVEGYHEGDAMRNYLVKHGVPTEKIIVDNQGINTYHTAQNYMGIAQKHGFNSVIAVSHYYHIPRTVMALKRLGANNVQGYAPAISEQPDVFNLPREFAAFYYYLFKYR